MAKFKLLTQHFIAPELYKEGTVLDYEGPVNEAMEPLEPAAQVMLDEYFAKHPKATINPVDQLPKVVATALVVEPEAPAVPKIRIGGNQ